MMNKFALHVLLEPITYNSFQFVFKMKNVEILMDKYVILSATNFEMMNAFLAMKDIIEL